MLVLLAGCREAPTPVELPRQDAAKIEEWTRLVRGMRMDLVDASGKLTKAGVPVLDYRSITQPTILALWASYCPPCLEDMDMFDELAEDGYPVIGVSLDGENRANFAKVLAEKSPDYPQGVLQTAWMKRVGLSLESGIPFTILLNRHGEVRYLFRGKITKNELLSAIERIRS